MLFRSSQTNAEPAEGKSAVGEPVAWLINGYLSDEYFRTSELDEIEPLYTTPQTKPLSDEEIIEVFESPFHPKTTGRIDDEVIAFARAIEERILGK